MTQLYKGDCSRQRTKVSEEERSTTIAETFAASSVSLYSFFAKRERRGWGLLNKYETS